MKLSKAFALNQNEIKLTNQIIKKANKRLLFFASSIMFFLVCVIIY